ncbi:MAG: GMC oxidoreductase [Propionibacteriaceae bacterium]|nr:GMC oxidoreductase [Propionibacteriaceae bacterium]
MSNPLSVPRPSRRALLAGAAGAAVALSTPRIAEASGPSQVENLVIGTGYGGAVAAYRLATAGRPVHMLEMGKRWNRRGLDGRIFSRMLGADHRSTWFGNRTALPLSTMLGLNINLPILRSPGVLDRVNLGAMNVYVGRGVGGGSLVNGGMAPRPRRDVIARELPGLDIDAFFTTYLPRAESRLGVNSISPAFRDSTPWYQFTRTGSADARAAGLRIADVPGVYDFAYMEQEATGQARRSALDGQVIYGNDHGKRDVTKTYLAWAEATGRVSIDTMTEALTITRRGAGYEVQARVRDVTGRFVANRTYRCQRLFLAAGSTGSSELLLRSRAAGGLTDLSGDLGKFWGPNGNVMVGRANPLHRPTGGFQSTIPVAGIDNWDSKNPAFIEIAPLPVGGIDLFIQLYLAVTGSPVRSQFEMSDGRLTLAWTRADSAPAIAMAKATLDQINRRMFTLYRYDLFGTGRAFSDDFTYHPLGGAVLGKVTDNYGRVHGNPGLYVTDGALIPGLVGVNPFLTITALAERLMDQVVARDL